MFELLEDILLSQVLMFLVLIAMMIWLTRWALGNKEHAGYALGWLVGILFIVVYQSVTGGESTGEEVQETVETTERGMSAFAVVTTSIFGIILGYGGLYFTEVFGRTHRRRAVTVAIMTALLVIAIYFVLGLSDSGSRIIGIFALGFGVGALTNLVLDSTGVPTRQQAQSRVADVQAQPLNAPLPGEQINPPPQSSLDEQREKFNRLRRQRPK